MNFKTNKPKKSLGLNYSSNNRPARKSLGQNFLTSTNIAKDIVSFGELSLKDTVLEIGPGRGILTNFLLETGARVVAAEKDYELFNQLKETFSKEIKSGRLILLNEDILKFEISSSDFGLRTSDYKLISNIPYNITGQIIRRFLTDTVQPTQMILMIQKEVGERIIANDGKESVLSLSVKAYGTVKIVKNVSKRHFLPQPKVDSVVINIQGISRQNFKQTDEKVFFKAIKAGFAHKRKKLLRNLSEVFPSDVVNSVFSGLKLDTNTRAEDVSLEKWLEMARLLPLVESL